MYFSSFYVANAKNCMTNKGYLVAFFHLYIYALRFSQTPTETSA